MSTTSSISSNTMKARPLLEEPFNAKNWTVVAAPPLEDIAHRCVKAEVTSVAECDPAKKDWKCVGFF